MSDAEPTSTADAVEPTASAAAPSWLKAIPLWVKVVVPLVVVALIVTVVVLAIPHSKNSQACSDFEKAYNGLATSVKEKMGSDIVGAMASNLTLAAADAHDEAFGAVKSDLSDVVSLSDGFISGDSDSSIAFLLAAGNVSKSCAADGAPIHLDDF